MLERELERSFAADETTLARQPNGWPASLVFFHIAQWRERLRVALSDVEAGRPYTPPPANIDQFNDEELPAGRGLPLSETSARADELLGALMGLNATLGDRPFEWTITKTTADALVRNSYFHPRIHVSEYWRENGETSRSHELLERTAEELRDLWPSPLILGAGLYNLAAVRVAQGRPEDALSLLEEAAPMRPDLLSRAPADADLESLRGSARFEAVAGRS